MTDERAFTAIIHTLANGIVEAPAETVGGSFPAELSSLVVVGLAPTMNLEWTYYLGRGQAPDGESANYYLEHQDPGL